MHKAILIIGDPLNSLAFSSDSSLALAEGALELGWQVHWTTPDKLLLINCDTAVQDYEIIRQVNQNSAPQTESIKTSVPLLLSSYHRVLIRKDPPFDESYTELCWFLLQNNTERIINSPRALLTLHEKMLPFILAKLGVIPDHCVVPSFVSQSQESLIAHAQKLFEQAESLAPVLAPHISSNNLQFKVLTKPWRGHGGRGIQVFESVEQMKRWLEQHHSLSPSSASRLILQPFLPEIFTQGDRRVFVVNGRIAFDFVRRPAPGKIEANLAQGGSAQLDPMSAEQTKLASQIALWLKDEGVLVAGLDFIGDFLTEVNITSPTGIRTFEQLAQQRISRDIMLELLTK